MVPPSSRPSRGILGERSSEWVLVTHSSRSILRDRIVQLYWHGVAQEVRLLIKTMRIWQKEKYADVHGENEVFRTEDINGFRAFVERAVGKPKSEREQDALLQTIQQSERNTARLSADQMRAQMLLQGSGFLDTSKIMEYKDPQRDYNLWATPRAAQLVLNNPDQINQIPKFSPAVCAHCWCTIRGIQFRCVTNCGQFNCTIDNCPCRQPGQRPASNGPLLFCETCKRANVHPERHLQKFAKRCILREAVTPRRRHQICICENKPPSIGDDGDNDDDRDDGVDSHFAVDGGYLHQPRCPMWRLKRRYEGVKFQELRRYRTRTQARGIDRRIGSRNPFQIAASKAVGSSAQAVTPPIQFGNVHMMLMIGTIIIENGVSDSKAGARISIRKPPHLAMVTEHGEEKNPMMCVNPKRQIFQRYGELEQPRRIKAIMKQVVGGSFTGLCDRDAQLELDIINALVEGSKRCWIDGTKTQIYLDRVMAHAVNQIVSKLRVLIGEKVIRYFDFIAAKLFDPQIELKWDQITNHCQQFCARILDFKAFGSFFATTPTCRTQVPRNPLYLVSFVCPPGSYDSPRRIRPGTKKQAPNSLTEEYLLRFRCHGHHEESDHIDTLREYWNDWGAFGGTLYKYQDLFPWDCTEAYRQGEPERHLKCNDCSIINHVGSYPFDTWSMAQLHLCRDRSLYSPSNGSDDRTLKDEEWMRNRLDVLSAWRALTVVTVAMAKTISFRATCRWNRERRALTPDIASRLDRVKLSGIYRAQPYSHSFEQSKYHDCTLAKWALKSREDQIREYEELRDYRAEELAELSPPPLRNSNRHRFRVPLDTRNEQPNWNDIWGEIGSFDRQQDVRDTDSESVEVSDSEDEYVNEEYSFEEGGGMIPSNFGPDPEESFDQYSSTEEISADDHDQGAGSCNYEQEDKWLDVSDGVDTCRDPIAREEARIVEENNQRTIIVLLAAGVPYNEIITSMVNPDDPDPSIFLINEATYKRIIDEFAAMGIPLDLFVPSNINPDDPDPASVLDVNGISRDEFLADGISPVTIVESNTNFDNREPSNLLDRNEASQRDAYEETSPPNANSGILDPTSVLNSNTISDEIVAKFIAEGVPPELIAASIAYPDSSSVLNSNNNNSNTISEEIVANVIAEGVPPDLIAASRNSDDAPTIRNFASTSSPFTTDVDSRNSYSVPDRSTSFNDRATDDTFTSGFTEPSSAPDISPTSYDRGDNNDNDNSKPSLWSRVTNGFDTIFGRGPNRDSDYDRGFSSTYDRDNYIRDNDYTSGFGSSNTNNDYSSGFGSSNTNNDYSSGFGSSLTNNDNTSSFGNSYTSSSDYSSWGGGGSGWSSSSNNNNDSSW